MKSIEEREKHVYFVRHGEAENNIGDKINRGPGSMLTERGKQQAQVVAERAKKLDVYALISSTYPRTLDTAAAIARSTGLTVEPNDLFVEWKHASGMLHKSENDPEVKAIQSAIHSAEDSNYRHSDEETFAELAARGVDALEYLRQHSADRMCVVTHAGFLRVLFGTAVFHTAFTRKDFVSLFWNVSTLNSGITYFRYEPERGWRVISWNDSSHLG